MAIISVIKTVFALTAILVGWGMWKEPHLDMATLLSLITNEVTRLANDLFAILGIVIMLLGLWILFKTIEENVGPNRLQYFSQSEEQQRS